MAGKTRNSVMVQARKRADELASKRREREENLKELATEYLMETMTADQLVEDAERAAAELVKEAKSKATAARERAKKTVVKMLATGETRNGVAELLDVSLSFVRGIDVATTKKTAKSGDTDPDEASAPQGATESTGEGNAAGVV